MEAEHIKKQIARTRVNRDVIVLYMLSKKYKLDLLSLLILYEIYDKDVFLFFYILSTSTESNFVGKTLEEMEFGDSISGLPKESNLKLMFTKAKKVSDALRRNSEVGLTSVTLPWYNQIKEYCIRDKSGDNFIDFYSLQQDNPKPAKKRVRKEKKETTKKEEKETAKKKEKVLA